MTADAGQLWMAGALGEGARDGGGRLVLEEVDERPIAAHIVPDNIGSQRVVEHRFVRRRSRHDGVHELIFRLD
jgi:hypothetical protein